MKTCENCGLTHQGVYGSGRFCTEKCARCFSSKEKRLDINRKVSAKLTGRSKPQSEIDKIIGDKNGQWIDGRSYTKYTTKTTVKKVVPRKKYKYLTDCNSCGCETSTKFCSVCRGLLKNRSLFKKLNITNSNMKTANKLAVDKLKEEYFIKNLSLIEIRNKYGIMFNTVHFFFKKNDIDLRSFSDSLSLSYLEGRNIVRINPKYKQGWHTTWDGRNGYYHSSYELEYALMLDKQHIIYDIEFLRIRYFDTQKQKQRTAIPDFYLPETNTIVEVKSEYTFDKINIKDKFKRYRELGYNTKLILEHKEVEFLL